MIGAGIAALTGCIFPALARIPLAGSYGSDCPLASFVIAELPG
jgi:hypothetical protein